MPDIKIFAENVEQSTIDQIESMCTNPVFENSKIRIMPDCHAGAGCVIGTTATIVDKVQPSFVGVDIGCGVTAAKVQADLEELDFASLDDFIRNNIPSGFAVHAQNAFKIEELAELRCFDHLKSTDRLLKSLGTLGGGNHFIEVAKGDKSLNVIVHSGSRNIGHQVASYYEAIAKKQGGFLENENANSYLHDMGWCTQFAANNRMRMLQIISSFMPVRGIIESVHNYISADNILRKGAISANEDEMCIIPLNMRDGSLLCRGKGNEDWNCSAPHGAGRILGRRKAKELLDIEVFKESMNGIFTTSVSEDTIDESPMAYKEMDYIIRMIEPTVEVIDVLKPVYNFKAA